jgi:hypothetical protein
MIEISFFLLWALLFMVGGVGFYIGALFQHRERKKDEYFYKDFITVYKSRAENAEFSRDCYKQALDKIAEKGKG